jgi:hypothetical protein
MAVSAVTINNEGRIAVFGNLAGISVTVAASSTAYLTANGGLPIDLATVLNTGGPFSAPINPGDVFGLMPLGLSKNNFLPGNLTLGRSVADGVTTVGSTTLSSATAAFVASDVGYSVLINGAGPGGAAIVATIISQTGTACVIGAPWFIVAGGVYTAMSAASQIQAGTAETIVVRCPTYTVGDVQGSVTRVDANVRPQLTLATCPAAFHFWATGASSAAALGEFADGNNSDTVTFLLLIARGGTNTN